MHEQRFDRFTRGGPGALSRRHSLKTLGGAALTAAVARPSMVQAGKDSKKVKKRFEKKCKKQVDPYLVTLTSFSQGRAVCEKALLPCCTSLKTCKAGTSLDCFFSKFS